LFRVRALKAGQASGWSNTLDIRLAPVIAYHVKPLADYQTRDLNDVHCALLRLSAAHGELFTVLGLPQHFRETEAREHLSRLATQFANEHNPSPLSYGAAYHPWLQCRSDSGAIVTMPPDGAALGVLAVRATDRGAWVAPANHRFNTVVALTSPFLSEADVPLNDIRNQPNGFMALRADTLDTDDPALRLISVRRLLILVRRLALRHGAIYAFEPNSDQLRGLVQHRFEQLLRGLYDRGAFSGQGPAQAYQVTADSALNTRLSVDQGRLLVELRVRPSLPMEFITVRLLQRGTGLSVSEGR
jgi:phage tail sheath protein FI